MQCADAGSASAPRARGPAGDRPLGQCPPVGGRHAGPVRRWSPLPDPERAGRRHQALPPVDRRYVGLGPQGCGRADGLIDKRGTPGVIVSDNGTELTPNASLARAEKAHGKWHYIAPVTPMRDTATPSAGRAPQRDPVLRHRPRPQCPRRMGHGRHQRAATFRPGLPDPDGLRRPMRRNGRPAPPTSTAAPIHHCSVGATAPCSTTDPGVSRMNVGGHSRGKQQGPEGLELGNDPAEVEAIRAPGPWSWSPRLSGRKLVPSAPSRRASPRTVRRSRDSEAACRPSTPAMRPRQTDRPAPHLATRMRQAAGANHAEGQPCPGSPRSSCREVSSAC